MGIGLILRTDIRKHNFIKVAIGITATNIGKSLKFGKPMLYQ